MTDHDAWGDQLPHSTQHQLRRILHDESRDGVVVLTPERTSYLLNRFHELRMTLKRVESVRIPLLGTIRFGK